MSVSLTEREIREAMELADGFSIEDEGMYINYIGYCTINNYPMWFLDAVRCQLERQIDMAGKTVEILAGASYVYEGGIPLKRLSGAKGPNRTTNTIRSILLSKVLQ